MITDIGKEIVAKYLLGTAPAYASYMAFGCGPKPLGDGDSHDTNLYKEKTVLDFEMFRVPISSKGYVKENNQNKLVFTAELPSLEKYEITEIGIYSAGSNPSASGFDSKNIILFTEQEAWQYVTTSPTAIPQVLTPLDPAEDNVIDVPHTVFQTNTDNRIFYRNNRNDYHERCRFFNNIIMVPGDFSSIKDATETSNLSSVYHILKTGLSINLFQNSLLDKIKIGFSLINKSTSLVLDPSYDNPDKVKIIIDFINDNNKKARLVCNVNKTDDGVDFTSNRYYIIEKNISDAIQDDGFSWQNITSMKIYSCVVDGGSLSDNYYVAFDAIRIDNVTTQNPLYGLVGYTIVKNTESQPILKATNTNNYVEFRMTIGVV